MRNILVYLYRISTSAVASKFEGEKRKYVLWNLEQGKRHSV